VLDAIDVDLAGLVVHGIENAPIAHAEAISRRVKFFQLKNAGRSWRLL